MDSSTIIKFKFLRYFKFCGCLISRVFVYINIFMVYDVPTKISAP